MQRTLDDDALARYRGVCISDRLVRPKALLPAALCRPLPRLDTLRAVHPGALSGSVRSTSEFCSSRVLALLSPGHVPTINQSQTPISPGRLPQPWITATVSGHDSLHWRKAVSPCHPNLPAPSPC
jgi:hypothetical protein